MLPQLPRISINGLSMLTWPKVKLTSIPGWVLLLMIAALLVREVAPPSPSIWRPYESGLPNAARMAHVRASGSAGRSSSQKKIPRLVPPLIITVRIFACISISSPGKSYAHVERFVMDSFVRSATTSLFCSWFRSRRVSWQKAWDLGCLPTLVDHDGALERDDDRSVLIVAAGLHHHNTDIRARP